MYDIRLLGRQVKRYREAIDMSQDELAGIVGVSAKTISRIETHNTIPDALLCMKLADALGLHISQVYGVADWWLETA